MTPKEALDSLLTHVGVTKATLVWCTMNCRVSQCECVATLNALNVHDHTLLWNRLWLHELVGKVRKSLQDCLHMLHFPIIALPLHKSEKVVEHPWAITPACQHATVHWWYMMHKNAAGLYLAARLFGATPQKAHHIAIKRYNPLVYSYSADKNAARCCTR